MCHFQFLYRTEEGYVVRCRECACYQVVFGTAMLSLVQEDYNMLMSILQFSADDTADLPRDLRKVHIPTPAAGVSLLLTPSEVRCFRDMLQEADNEHRANQLLGLFETGG